MRSGGWSTASWFTVARSVAREYLAYGITRASGTAGRRPFLRMTEPRVFVLGAGFSQYAGMPLVRDLKAEVLEWIDRNQDRDSRIGPFIHPIKNWPEFPEEKCRARLDFVD
jgi:hypothetical protein